jgi:hypothetical protein
MGDQKCESKGNVTSNAGAVARFELAAEAKEMEFRIYNDKNSSDRIAA